MALYAYNEVKPVITGNRFWFSAVLHQRGFPKSLHNLLIGLRPRGIQGEKSSKIHGHREIWSKQLKQMVYERDYLDLGFFLLL